MTRLRAVVTRSGLPAGLLRLARAAGPRRLARDKSGAAAVEFALVAAPFLAILFATLQTAIIFFADQTLETAVADSSRLIMTGQAQQANFDAVAFKNAVCARVFAVFNCQSGISVDVRTAASFGAAGTSKPIDPSTGQFTNNFVYQPGGPGDIVVVRAVYQWPVYVTLLGLNLSNMAGGKRMLMATAAFRNEPF